MMMTSRRMTRMETQLRRHEGEASLWTMQVMMQMMMPVRMLELVQGQAQAQGEEPPEVRALPVRLPASPRR